MILSELSDHLHQKHGSFPRQCAFRSGSPTPQAAQYEELLAGALQVFYKSTMQGRNQQRLNEIRCAAQEGATLSGGVALSGSALMRQSSTAEILASWPIWLTELHDAVSKKVPRPGSPRRERRKQECAHEAARQEAQQRRAENLRQWMAALCQRHRDEREARAAAAAEAAAAGLDGNQVGSDGSSLAGAGSSGSSASSDGGGADAVAVLQQYLVCARQALPTPLCSSLAGASARPQQAQQHKGPAWHSVASRQAVPAQRGGKPGQAAGLEPNCCGLSVTGVSAAAVAGCSDSARTSLAGPAQPTSSSGTGDKGGAQRRPLSAGPRSIRPEPVTVEAVIEQRQAAAAAGAAGDRKSGV